MASDRMMEYYYSMGQDCLHTGSIDDAVTYFRKAANLGAREAAEEICQIGEKLEEGECVSKDEAKAENCWKIAASYDISRANLLLGRMYMKGINGGKPNPRKARRSLERASDDGSAEAASLLGKLYDEGMLGRVSPEKAFQYYLLAAERGDTAAMLMTGLFYAQGTSVRKDLLAAEMWIRKGREEGDPDGDATLRVFLSVACAEYVTGQAGVVDEEKAEAMAKEAEELGDKDVYYRLGDAYTKTGRHQEEAYASYEKATKNGIIAAYSAMGLCLEAGIGVKSDIAKAVSWYKKAAEEGDAFGMAHYGYALSAGEGCEKDEKEAMAWLIKAAMKGDEGAIRVLREDYQYELQ